MHFVVSPIGSAGDVHPFLGLAVELKRRGHRVTFVVNEYFRPAAERYGLEYVEFGTRDEFLEAIAHPDLWHPVRALGHIFRTLQPGLRIQYDAFVDRYEPGRTVGIANAFGFGALTAQDKTGMPVLTVHMQPSVLWSDVSPPTMPAGFGPRWLQGLLFRIGERFFVDPVVGPGLNAMRREVGLPPVRKIIRWWNSRSGVFCMFPEWYAPRQPDWPTPLWQTDFSLWDERSEEPLSDEAAKFLADGDRPIVFTPGSAYLFGESFFAAAAEACRKLQRRGILLTRFAEQIPQSLPPGVVHFDYVPLNRLLPQCAAFVNHGGIGSISQGMAAGIPQVIMPMAHDQFDNADRLRRLQVGATLLPRHFTADRLAAALKSLLDSSDVQTACRQAAERLRLRNGLSLTADAIEAWVRDHDAAPASDGAEAAVM